MGKRCAGLARALNSFLWPVSRKELKLALLAMYKFIHQTIPAYTSDAKSSMFLIRILQKACLQAL